MNLKIDPAKRAELAAAFPSLSDEYRAWALSESTRKFVALVADYLTPRASTAAERSCASEALAKLVRREVVEEFVDAIFRLEDYAVVRDVGLPDTDYGAGPRKPERSNLP